MKVRYVGPHDGVDVMLPNGETKTVMRGEEVFVPRGVGKSLLEQGLRHWEPVAKPKVAAGTVADKAADAAGE